ncbi:MAG: glycosyltransferase family 2 protein [Deltaproteobacteria bacterium]|nr:glycosyltransferase family 2 protein [Deltaproteobacteria bacterium]
MNETLPLVSVVIVNWNGKRFLEKNLSSIFNQTYRTFEVILVDNGSSDGSVEFVAENFPKTIIIKNKENTGFAAANNQGIKIAKGNYVATLNNDTELDKDWLKNLASAAASSDVHVGMWAPKILSLQDPKRIDSVGGLLIYRDGIARGRGRLEQDKGQYDKVEEILFPSACSALYRKNMLDEIGYFDEDFFAYCEDTDLGLRARLAGWKAISVPHAITFHHYSGTTGKYSQTKAFLVERNHMWAALKNFPVTMVLTMPIYTLWRWLIQTINVIHGKGATSHYVRKISAISIIAVLFNAYVAAARNIPWILKKRWYIQKKKAVSNKEIRQWFKRYGLSARGVVND